MIDIEVVRELCAAGTVQVTNHMAARLIKRGISIYEVMSALKNGKIIEQYPEDFPYPSCLIYGLCEDKPLHIVCGVGERALWLITAYYPSAGEWDTGFEKRKGAEKS